MLSPRSETGLRVSAEEYELGLVSVAVSLPSGDAGMLAINVSLPTSRAGDLAAVEACLRRDVATVSPPR